MQCFETNGMNGIRIWNNNGAKISWGTESATAATVGTRDMVVMRHKKGENNLHVYTANIYGDDIVYTEINRGRITQTNATLVFGCAKADDGEYERFAKGDVYWAKVWYADLGDNACRKLAAWPHETREYEMCGFKQFYLSDNTNKRCAMTFLAKNTLARKMPITSSYYNNGGRLARSNAAHLPGQAAAECLADWMAAVDPKGKSDIQCGRNIQGNCDGGLLLLYTGCI